jgi:hypothetical protein
MTPERNSLNKIGYGTLGLDVGIAGHWARLIFGSLLLLYVLVNLIVRFSMAADPLRWYGQLLAYFAVITSVYTAVYWLLGERGVLRRLSPWANTAIFVGPAFVIAWWDFLVAPFTGNVLPGAFWFAMLAYIGLSFVLQWRLKYGGCEVVALPIMLFRKRYPTYCIPLVALDAVEKAVVDSRSKTKTN